MPTKYYVNSIDREFAALARRKRKSLGVPTQWIADHMDALGIPMHRVRISKWENDNGGKLPTLGEALALAHVLDIDIDGFLRQASAEHWQTDVDAAYRSLLKGSSLIDGLSEYAAGESVSSDWLFADENN